MWWNVVMMQVIVEGCVPFSRDKCCFVDLPWHKTWDFVFTFALTGCRFEAHLCDTGGVLVHANHGVRGLEIKDENLLDKLGKVLRTLGLLGCEMDEIKTIALADDEKNLLDKERKIKKRKDVDVGWDYYMNNESKILNNSQEFSLRRKLSSNEIFSMEEKKHKDSPDAAMV